MGSNNLSIPQLQRCNLWSLGMDKYFHPTFNWTCDYLFMLGLNLNHVSKKEAQVLYGIHCKYSEHSFHTTYQKHKTSDVHILGIITVKYRYVLASSSSIYPATYEHGLLCSAFMLTSWNGSIFRVTGPLSRESIGHRWIRLTQAIDAELWSAPEQTVEQRIYGPVIWIAVFMTSLWCVIITLSTLGALKPIFAHTLL